MKASLETARKRIEMQGFVGLSDEQIGQFNYWLRLAPGLCAAWIAVGVINASPIILVSLIPFALAGGLTNGHPFDVIYNRGIRHLLGRPELPDYRMPRRFACLMASTVLTTTATLFAVGWNVPAYVLGVAMTLMATTNVITGICGPAIMFERLVRKLSRTIERVHQ